MQLNDRQFVAQCFEAEPSAGPLCKTVEAACKLRYQKCLDAHSRMRKENQQQQQQQQKPTNNRRLMAKTSPVAAAIKSSISGVFAKILNKPSQPPSS